MKKGFTIVEFMIIIAVLSLVVFFIGSAYKAYAKQRSSVPSIYRLERPLKQITVNQSGISGSFFLGSGSINGGEKEYFFYYKIKEGNKFKPASVFLKEVSIVEDGQNKVVFITEPLKKDEIAGLENKIDQGEFGYFWNDGITEFEFHIPPGSILEEYNPNFSSLNQ